MTLGEGMGVIILRALRDFPEAKLGLEPKSSPAKRWLCLLLTTLPALHSSKVLSDSG